MPEDRQESKRLSDHLAWVRALAGRLAANAHEADDLAQDAWVAAMRAPLGEVRSLRSYLGGVLRNRRRVTRRAESRRREHERQAAERAELDATEGMPAAEAALERAEVARALVDEVLALEEPFRSVVLLRYGEGLSAREVAARLGVPLKTVESRARRGLARLREAWLRRHGGDGATWRGVLAWVAAPLGANAPPVSPASTVAGAAPASPLALLGTLGVFAMNMKIAALVVTVAGFAGAAWLWMEREGEAVGPTPLLAVAPRHQATLVPSAQDAGEPLASQAPRERQLVPEATSAAAAATKPPESAPTRSPRVLSGRVFDTEARPFGGVQVVYDRGWSGPSDEGPAARTTSTADGHFELTIPSGTGIARAQDPRLETLVAARVQGSASVDALIVVAAHRPLSGRVVDEVGRPVASARVTLELPRGFFGRFDAILDVADVRLPSAKSAEDGRFALPRAPIVLGAELVVVLDGYLPARFAAPSTPANQLELVLLRPRTDDALLGRVVDAAGAPAADARVTLGVGSAISDVTGAFVLAREGAQDAVEITAFKRGHRPGLLTVERDPASGEPLWPAWIELRLGGPPLVLGGVVVDEHGAPRPGVKVWVEDTTPFGILGDNEIGGHVEYLLGALEATGGVDRANWHSVETDGEGRFELPGLLEREYTLRLLDVKRFETRTVGPFAAGERGLRITFPRGEVRPLRGRIVSGGGAPLEGVTLFLNCAAFGGMWNQGGWTRTDAQGRFSFDQVGNARFSLMLRGDGIVPDWRFLGPEALDGEQEIVADTLCHVKVELADPTQADGFHIRDATGKLLDLYQIGATGVTYGKRFDLIDGRSRTVGVSERGATLVLERAGIEVGRMSIRLVPGRVNLLSP